LLFTGDVLMHSPLWNQARRNAEAATREGLNPLGVHRDFRPMFAHFEPLIRAADLAICHLETPIAPEGEEYSTHPRYGVPAEVVDGLAAAGFEHCSTASNHTFDRQMPAFEATVARFEAAGITQHGMAATEADAEATILNVDGLLIAHLSATYGFDLGRRPPEEPWRSDLIEPELLIAKASRARERGAEIVVLSLHWGNSTSSRASDSQKNLAAQFAASGVIDLIVGHHAHAVQPIEAVGEMWVAYGLGNFISTMPVPGSIWPPSSRDGIVVTIEIDRSGSRPRLTTPVARPLWVDHDAGWVVRDLATTAESENLMSRIGNEVRQSWQRTARVVGDYLVAWPTDSPP
jgi:poly-gamma-glutamate capsule biosynthesis protein CapA/YwtB (metallophosphatase superfamily)